MCGTLYTKPCVLVIGSEDDFPVFGKLKNIYVAVAGRKRTLFREAIVEKNAFRVW